MQLLPGNIVRSTAGRDKDHLYVVVTITPNRVMVADGVKRLVSAPKPKNCLHLQLVDKAKVATTDDDIRRILQSRDLLEEKKGGIYNG